MIKNNINTSFARKHGVLSKDSANGNEVIFREKLSLPILAEIYRAMGEDIAISVVDNDEFEEELKNCYELQASDTIQSIDGIDQELDLNQIAYELNEPDELLERADDAPIVRLLNALVTEAVREDASDIHIEQYEDRLRVRFRIDGALKEILQPDVKIAPLIVSRVKIMSKLDIAERRLPQDGRISVRVGGRPVDIRVSTIPSGSGAEKVVLRLLNKETGRLDLEYLGMDEVTRKKIEEAILRPYGILLVTGPTGSGKTTTLYAMLSRLNDQQHNIMTVEDPVEYFIDGINQTQVNANVGMSFASGLRSILRQDPDIIMIGEIRDLETARIAVQSSLTGHVVFSTLHTNTAIGAVTRLRDMGVEPFLLSSSLNGVLAQRLLRNLCPSCKKSYQADEAEKHKLDIPVSEDRVIYREEGCAKCNFTGYKGRSGLFDFISVDETISAMIHKGASEQEMLHHIRETSPDLYHMGIDLVLAGTTSLAELIRVAGSVDN